MYYTFPSDAGIRAAVAVATQEPTGFDRLHPETMGVIELSPDGTIILRVDQHGVYSMNSSGKFGFGTPFEQVATPRTFAIYPAATKFSFWSASRFISYSVMKTLSLTDATGQRLVYFNSAGELAEETVDFGNVFAFYSPVSAIYGNSTSQQKIVFGDERHGIRMDGGTHSYLHQTRGTQYLSGAQINGLASNATVYTTIDSGIFMDEDITLTPAFQTNSPFWYRLPSGWNITPDGVSLAYMGVRTYFNSSVGGVWALTPIEISNFTLIHFFFTNDVQFPYVKILGQNEYGTAKLAREGALSEVQKLALDGLPSLEFRAIFSIILDSSGRLVLTDTGDVAVDFRRQALK